MDHRKIAKNQWPFVFYNHLKRDFIFAELKPVSFLEEKSAQGAYFGYLFYDKDELVAYALFGKDPKRNYLLLDYLAVLPSYRDSGYGSKIITLIKEKTRNYDGVFVEAEALEQSENKDEGIIRQRRLAFYRRNGLSEIKPRVEINGVTFTLLLMTEKKDLPKTEKLREELDAIYHTLFDKTKFEKSWCIF